MGASGSCCRQEGSVVCSVNFIPPTSAECCTSESIEGLVQPVVVLKQKEKAGQSQVSEAREQAGLSEVTAEAPEKDEQTKAARKAKALAEKKLHNSQWRQKASGLEAGKIIDGVFCFAEHINQQDTSITFEGPDCFSMLLLAEDGTSPTTHSAAMIEDGDGNIMQIEWSDGDVWSRDPLLELHNSCWVQKEGGRNVGVIIDNRMWWDQEVFEVPSSPIYRPDPAQDALELGMAVPVEKGGTPRHYKGKLSMKDGWVSEISWSDGDAWLRASSTGSPKASGSLGSPGGFEAKLAEQLSRLPPSK
eukprot:TRINITY_DN16619_c0_g1_i3.p1 TRINITY_DN16619_c0_g1~~TRINITY_DN16619_c0_g1_i3.p1  ORF type:complete len:303 (+),score=49.92 TRINITY_DN16619_c0_g1_i3:54-962(+)